METEEVFPRIDNEIFIQILLLEGDQPESQGSARQPNFNFSTTQNQLIKFEDQQVEESPIIFVDKGKQAIGREADGFHQSLQETKPAKRTKSDGVSKILKIKGVGKAEDQKDRLAQYGPIQYLENHFHEKQ